MNIYVLPHVVKLLVWCKFMLSFCNLNSLDVCNLNRLVLFMDHSQSPKEQYSLATPSGKCACSTYCEYMLSSSILKDLCQFITTLVTYSVSEQLYKLGN